MCKCPVVLTVHCPPLSSSQPCDRTRTLASWSQGHVATPPVLRVVPCPARSPPPSRSPSSSSMDKSRFEQIECTDRARGSSCRDCHLSLAVTGETSGVLQVHWCIPREDVSGAPLLVFFPVNPQTHFFNIHHGYFSSERFRSVENKIRDKRKIGINKKKN